MAFSLKRRALLALVAWLLGAALSAAEWTTVPAQGAPNPRHEAAFVAHEGKFYLLGGRRIQPVDVFDPATAT